MSPLVSGMTHQDQTEVRRQMEEKVKRVGEMPKAKQRFGITLVASMSILKCLWQWDVLSISSPDFKLYVGHAQSLIEKKRVPGTTFWRLR